MQFPRMLLAAALAFGAAGAAHAAKDLVVGVPDANLTGLDPADLNDNLSQSAARLMFEGLYMLDEHMKLRPQLAESYRGERGRQGIHLPSAQGRDVP